MEESKALHKLGEVTDIIAMVEEMLNPTTSERLSPSAWSGIRVTLRNVRETVQVSHSALSAELLARSRASVGTAPQPAIQRPAPAAAAPTVSTNSVTVAPISAGPAMTEAQRIQMTRRDLKASLEKIIESGS